MATFCVSLLLVCVIALVIKSMIRKTENHCNAAVTAVSAEATATKRRERCPGI